MPTRDEIHDAILSATGNPDTGVVRDVTPLIVDAVDALCNPGPAKGKGTGPQAETRVVEAQETR